MTKRDYLVASYALALQAANAIRLVSATFTGVDSSVTTTGVWSQRYEYVYKRLAQLDAVKRVPDSIADWCDLVIHALRGLLTAKWDTIRKANPL